MASGVLEVSIVIPNYQGRGVLPETLAALDAALAGSRIRAEVILVDDASSDGSPEQAAREHPGLRLLRQRRNQGFGPSCNLGVEEARAPRVLLLNSDVSVHPGFLEPLLEQLETGHRFSVASLSLGEDGRVLTPNQVVPEMRRGQIRFRSLKPELFRNMEMLTKLGPFLTLFGSGSSVLMNRERFRSIGGFADAFAPYYYEDTDLGWRAWRRGWSTVLEPRSVVTHRLRGSIARTQCDQVVRTIRKRNRFLLVWRNLLDPAAFRRQHLCRLPPHLAGSLLRGDLTVPRGVSWAWARRAGISHFRDGERATARLRDAEIFSLLAEERARLNESMSGMKPWSVY